MVSRSCDGRVISGEGRVMGLTMGISLGFQGYALMIMKMMMMTMMNQ